MSDKQVLPYWAMGIIVGTYFIMPWIYFLLKSWFNPNSKMNLSDYYVMCLLIVFLVTGGYQLYFWSQHAYLGKVCEIQETWLDAVIPKLNGSVYVYNFLYYIGFGLVIVSIMSYKHFAHVLIVGLGLLLIHVIMFITFPTKLPNHSRSREEDNAFLRLTQSYDSLNNAFPSAHVSISILIYFLIRGVVGEWGMIFPILITLSCLLTKQHYVIDCLGGALLGVAYCLLIQQFYPFQVFV